MRTLPVLLLATGIVASLSACATAPFTGGCESTVTSGSASSVVTAEGPLGTAPTIDFPTPIVTKEIQRSELITGTGPQLSSGDVVMMHFTMLNGATGETAGLSDYTSTPQPITLADSVIPAVTEGLQCVTVGSRVAIASSAADAGQDPETVTDSIVFVVDVLGAYPGKAYGVPQTPQAGMPAVVTAPSGVPGVTVPRQDPPSELTVNVLRQADGDTLKSGDKAVLKYTALLWADSSVFYSTWYSTWTNGQASILPLTTPDAPSKAVTQGLVEGLVGQQVGSQVLIVVPPGDGFGSAVADGVPAGSTLVYVVDILGVSD